MDKFTRGLATLLMLMIVGITAGLSQTLFEFTYDESSWPLRAVSLMGFLAIGIIVSTGYFAIIVALKVLPNAPLNIRAYILALLAIPVALALGLLGTAWLLPQLCWFFVLGTATLALAFVWSTRSGRRHGHRSNLSSSGRESA